MFKRISLARRQFLSRSSVATVAAASIAAPSLASAAAGSRSKRLEELDAADFEHRLGQTFALYGPEHKLGVKLESVQRNPHAIDPAQPAATRTPFSLLFRAPAGDELESRMYRLTHTQMGRMTLLLHRVGSSDAEGRFAYEAVLG